MPSPTDHQALRQAAHWYVQLGSEAPSAQDRAAWQAWCDSDPRHAQAWQHVEALQTRIRPLPKGMGQVLLQATPNRRRVLGGLATVCVGLGAWAVASTQTDWLAPTQSYATQRGERRAVALDDGGRLLLNTGTRVAVRYGPQGRTVWLEQGELQIQTAPDTWPETRPFVVETMHGQILALGTRFTVRLEAAHTRVAVQEHAVLLQPRSGAQALQLDAGQTASFSVLNAGERDLSPAEDSAWVDGRLTVLEQPLGRFVQELSRYRQQPIQVDPRVAMLQVSGTFLLDEPERSLRAAVAHLPVRLVAQGGQTLQILPR